MKTDLAETGVRANELLMYSSGHQMAPMCFLRKDLLVELGRVTAASCLP